MLTMPEDLIELYESMTAWRACVSEEWFWVAASC